MHRENLTACRAMSGRANVWCTMHSVQSAMCIISTLLLRSSINQDQKTYYLTASGLTKGCLDAQGSNKTNSNTTRATVKQTHCSRKEAREKSHQNNTRGDAKQASEQQPKTLSRAAKERELQKGMMKQMCTLQHISWFERSNSRIRVRNT